MVHECLSKHQPQFGMRGWRVRPVMCLYVCIRGARSRSEFHTPNSSNGPNGAHRANTAAAVCGGCGCGYWLNRNGKFAQNDEDGQSGSLAFTHWQQNSHWHIKHTTTTTKCFCRLVLSVAEFRAKRRRDTDPVPYRVRCLSRLSRFNLIISIFGGNVHTDRLAMV